MLCIVILILIVLGYCKPYMTDTQQHYSEGNYVLLLNNNCVTILYIICMCMIKIHACIIIMVVHLIMITIVAIPVSFVTHNSVEGVGCF